MVKIPSGLHQVCGTVRMFSATAGDRQNSGYQKGPSMSCWTKTFGSVFKVCFRKKIWSEKRQHFSIQRLWKTPWICFSFSFSSCKALRVGHNSQIPLVDLNWKAFSMYIIHLQLLAQFWNYTSPDRFFTQCRWRISTCGGYLLPTHQTLDLHHPEQDLCPAPLASGLGQFPRQNRYLKHPEFTFICLSPVWWGHQSHSINPHCRFPSHKGSNHVLIFAFTPPEEQEQLRGVGHQRGDRIVHTLTVEYFEAISEMYTWISGPH